MGSPRRVEPAPAAELGKAVVCQRVLAESVGTHVALPEALVRCNCAPRFAYARDPSERGRREELEQIRERRLGEDLLELGREQLCWRCKTRLRVETF